MASSTVTTYIDGDVSGLKKATRDAAKEFQNVAKAADKANTDAARGSAKAFSGISRMIATGKVSAKSIDKIGKSASNAISAASGFAGGIGAALGLGALPALSDLAIKAIGALREANKSLASRINDAAAAQRDLTLATLEAAGGMDAIIAADEKAAAAREKADKARTERKAGVKELTALEAAYTKAVRDQARAQKTSHDAATALTKARKPKTDGGEGKSGSQLTKLEKDQTNARIAATRATEAAAAAENALTEAKKRHKAPAAEVAKAERDAAAAEREARLARIQHEQQIVKADDATKKFAGTLQKEANTALRHFTLGTVEYDSQGVNYVKTTTDMAGATAELAAQLRKHAGTTLGLTEDQKKLEVALANYVETTRTVPKDIATVVALLGQGKSVKEIQKYLGLIDKVPDTAATTIQTPGMNRALGDAKGLYGALSRLDGKVVTTRIDNWTVTHTSREGVGPHGATGLQLAGRFDGRDNIPIWASAGEVLLNPRQQSMVDGGMSIDGALSATGAPTIRAGGGFAKGGKPKKLTAAQRKQKAAERRQRTLDRHQALLDNAKTRFGGFMSADDLLLAKAEQTPAFGDNASALGRERSHILARIAQIHRERRYKWLTAQQKQDLNDEEAGLIRQLADIGGQLTAGAGTTDTGGGGATEQDPWALQRATDAGMAAGLGRAAGYVFGGSGDIGSGGANALLASGSIPAVHIESVTFTNSVQNQGQIARAGNSGNDVLSGGRIASSRERVAF